MAPLKRLVGEQLVRVMRWYPCLKGHGPIEAFLKLEEVLLAATYPCLKGHGPIEAAAIPEVGRSTQCIHA